MRPGEVAIMRTGDVDTTAQPWRYRPAHYKTAHHQHEPVMFLGPKALEVLAPFLRPEQPSQYLFRPIDAERDRLERAHASRKTPLCGDNRPGSIGMSEQALRRAIELSRSTDSGSGI